jgi:hypothetical protein
VVFLLIGESFPFLYDTAYDCYAGAFPFVVFESTTPDARTCRLYREQFRTTESDRKGMLRSRRKNGI